MLLQKLIAEFLAKTPVKDLDSLKRQCRDDSWKVALNFYLRLHDGPMKISTTGHLAGTDFEEAKKKIVKHLEKLWL